MSPAKNDCEMCGGIGFIYDGQGSIPCPQCGGTGVEPGRDGESEEE